MAEEASLEFRLNKVDETRNYLLEEIKHNDLLNKINKNPYKCLNYVENFLILVSKVTACFSISGFALLA